MPPMPPMPPAFSQQQQHQEVAAGAAEEPFVQPELSEGFTAFFTTTHSSGVQSETGTGTSALTSSSSKSRPPPSKQPSITQHDQKNRGGHGSGGESSVGSSLSSSECSQPNKPQKTIHEGGSSGVNHVTSGTHVNKNVALYAADTDGPSKKRRTTEATRSTAVYQRSSSSIDAPGRDERELSKTLTTGPRQERGQVETSAPKSSAEDSPLVPGQPVTLDQVLRFSNIPR